MNASKVVLPMVAATALAAAADGLREDELTPPLRMQGVKANLSLDLRDRWPVETLEAIDLPYSAPSGSSVTLTVQDGALSGLDFAPGADFRVLATGLTGEDVCTWTPDGVEKRVYRIEHKTLHGGEVVADGTYRAYFDFTVLKALTKGDLRRAALGVSQPLEVADDALHPWSLVGGEGDGLRNDAPGATLAFTFNGRGVFSAELLIPAGMTMTVTVDGETVETVPAAAGWASYAWPVTGFGTAHTLTLTSGGAGEIAVRGCVFEQAGKDRIADALASTALDCRSAFPVAKLKDEPALQGFTYSAIGWGLDPAADATRTVTITAQSGTLADGVFTSDGSASAEVLAATTGKGTVDWQPSEISKKVYQLTHKVSKNGTPDLAETLYGYLDFTACAAAASQAEVETAVLGALTHAISVTQDADAPWQPVDVAATGSGIATDAALASGDETTTAFAFAGHGVLHGEYRLTGGKLTVLADGKTVLTFTEPTAAWAPCEVAFADYGAHRVSFVYTAAEGAVAAIRNIRWEELTDERASGSSEAVAVDLREGIRRLKRFEELLPFAWSSTNFTGLAGATDASVARVSVVRLAPDSPTNDLSLWTNEVAGTEQVLVSEPGESSVVWAAKQGVWRALFEIKESESVIHAESAVFDLRKYCNGLLLILR